MTTFKLQFNEIENKKQLKNILDESDPEDILYFFIEEDKVFFFLKDDTTVVNEWEYYSVTKDIIKEARLKGFFPPYPKWST